MKTTLYCLAIAIAMRLAFEALAQNVNQSKQWVAYEHAYVVPGKVAVEWKFVDATRVWLSINSVQGAEWIKEGYHPGFTMLLSQYKPLVKQLPSGQYEITFSSEITKNLP